VGGTGTDERHVIDRLGAALVAPVRAMSRADSAAGAGRAPADLAVLVLVGFTAANLAPLVRVGWLLVDGEAMSAVHILLARLSDWLRAPLVCAVVAGVFITLTAGRRRALGADFDLACVACVPLAALVIPGELVARAGVHPALAGRAALAVGLAWSAALVLVAVRQARRRAAKGAA
jgi:hypothetical protein